MKPVARFNCSSASSENSTSWSRVENFTRHWLLNWVEENELYYGSILSSSNLSNKCYQSLKQYASHLKSFDPNAVQMFDASGKLPSGLLQGSWTDLGAFDQCLSIPSSQYCLVYSKIPFTWSNKFEGFFHPKDANYYHLSPHYNNTNIDKWLAKLLLRYGHYFLHMNITTGLCLPLGCSTDELRLLITSAFNKHNTGLVFDVNDCQTHSVPIQWHTHEIIAAIIIIAVIAVNIVGTFAPSSSPLDHFNVSHNLPKIFSSPQRTSFPCLGGIKSLTMIYLIFGHVVWGLLFNSFDQLFAAPSTLINPAGLPILLGPNTLETFFLVSGLEITTFFMSDKSPTKSVSFTIFLFARWARFAITVGWFLCVNILVFSDHFRVAFGGPFWHHLQSAASISSTCAESWLNHLLLIAHYFDSSDNWETCLLADWYLEVDFIYAALFYVILIPNLTRKPFMSILSSILIIFLGTMVTTIVTIMYDVQTSWLPTNFVSNEFAKYLVYIHSKPWTHVAPYFIGVILAFILNSKKSRINKAIVTWGWLIFWLSVISISFYEITVNINSLPINRSLAILYGSTFRLIWSLCISWLIYACHHSLTWSWINRLLSSRFLSTLTRFNLNALFTNFLIIRLNNSTQRSLINLSLPVIMFNYMVPVILQTYLVSMIFTVLIDKPLTNLMIKLTNDSSSQVSKTTTSEAKTLHRNDKTYSQPVLINLSSSPVQL